MAVSDFSPSVFSQTKVGVEGVLPSLAPLPFLLAATTPVGSEADSWVMIVASVVALACLAATLLLVYRNLWWKMPGGLALFGCILLGWPSLASEPLTALCGGVVAIWAGFSLIDIRFDRWSSSRDALFDRRLQRARAALWTVAAMAVAGFLLNPHGQRLGEEAVMAAMLIGHALVAHWALRDTGGWKRIGWLAGTLAVMAAGILSLAVGLAKPAAIIGSLLVLVGLPRLRSFLDDQEHWWEPFLDHPARVLLSTFLGLCLFGTLLLQLPWMTTKGDIALVDAVFTSVSAVCVTGLIVLDTPNDFTLIGQGCILLLIQLGGFGIMTISTVALHAMGKRLSLRQERLLTTLTETSHRDLIGSLVMIVRFTLWAECVGAVLLTACFLSKGDPLAVAMWRGLFTAVSAFCNAGFALHSDSLIAYQTNPLVLHTVAALIVLGGLAPATCLILPAWIRGRAIPLGPRIALVTTAALLVAGTLFFLVFEWNATLATLSVADKCHNAWFQSVTLRTAGFNSVDISGVIGPTLLVMLGWMFIGGSPGGTAGGVKTTTIGVLAMTFWANVTGHGEVIVRNRRIPQATINRAITVVGSGVLIWLAAVLALQITQELPARDLIFEATSALATVGLSLGVTNHLDEIGKIIIILTMFIGRIGPMTLFTLLSWDAAPADPRCPDARITLN